MALWTSYLLITMKEDKIMINFYKDSGKEGYKKFIYLSGILSGELRRLVGFEYGAGKTGLRGRGE